MAGKNGPQNFSDDVFDFGIKSMNLSAKLNKILITFRVEIVALMPCV